MTVQFSRISADACFFFFSKLKYKKFLRFRVQQFTVLWILCCLAVFLRVFHCIQDEISLSYFFLFLIASFPDWFLLEMPWLACSRLFPQEVEYLKGPMGFEVCLNFVLYSRYDKNPIVQHPNFIWIRAPARAISFKPENVEASDLMSCWGLQTTLAEWVFSSCEGI